MRKVRIKGLPNKSRGGVTGGAMDGLRRFLEGKKNYDQGMNQFAEPAFEVNNTISSVPEDQANIEAEHGEIAIVPGMGGIPESYKITGERHNNGGVPLNLAEDSFIFSDHKKGKKGEKGMKINDAEILAEFGISVPKKGKPKGRTPADIAKKYKINDYKKVLLDPNSDKLERETAELMIQNYNNKLAKLALVQESMKGFPQGIPAIAAPYMGNVGATGEEFLPQEPSQDPNMMQGNPMEQMMAAYGAAVLGDPSMYSYQVGGSYGNRNMKKRFPGLTIAQDGGFTMGSTEFTGKFWDSILQGGGSPPPQQPAIAPKTTSGHYTIANPEIVAEANEKELQERLKHQQFVMDAAKAMNLSPEDTFQMIIDQDEKLMGKSYLPSEQDGGQLPSYQNRGEITRYQSFVAPDGNRYTIKDGVYHRVDDQGNIIGNLDTNQGTTTTEGGTEEVETSNRPTKSTNIPEDKKKDMNDPNLAVGDYYQGADDKWYKVTYVPPTYEYQGEDAGTVFGTADDASDYSSSYAFLEQQFNDPEVMNAFHKYTTDALRNKEYYKGKSGSYSEMYSEDEINKLTPEDTRDMFLKHQKRNYSLQANGVDPKDFKDSNGDLKDNISPEKKAYYENMGITSLNSAFDKFGMPITEEEQGAGHLGLEQGSYWGYYDMLNDKENMSPEMQEKLKYFHVPQEGEGDEPLNKTISPIDSKNANFYTNTTSGQLAVVDPTGMTAEEVEIPEEPTPEIPVEDPDFVQHVPRDEWWAQDIGNIGNLFGQRMGLKKYLPHSQPVDLARPDVLYFDPSRALAANAEQANIAAQASASFAGPQGTYRMSGIAGDAFRNAMGVLGDYENKNVAIGNQYLDKVTQVANQENLANAERLQRLFDQTTIANQQFDNSKRAANRNLFEAWRQGLTNKKMTQAMNTLYPQFETIPSIGGGLYYTGVERPFTNTGSSGTGSNTAYLDELNKLKTQYPDVEEASIRKQLDQKYGKNTPIVTSDPNRNQGNEMLNWMRGMQGAGAYPPGMYKV